ncbi:glycoside hydrolase/phage tail family protein [Stappia sp. ES.058]|uniref:baseplate multidomain protein megatron n=1 Tax=Stappia sp. ES.058 TaxID=1881061 RepID=UPI00087C7106|nr:glycoside hydrolase/phage tail family protein [Stappia sp. ES.058]SDT99138.1 Putative phage tail protein [Stappia sp. ES.058]
MATLVLAAAGKAIGGALLGGAGALLGQAAGAIAGYALDQSLFGATRRVEGRRLEDLSVQSSVEGASLPMVYGRVRLAGQIIWATRFEEEVREETSGGKGGGGGPRTTTRSYRYYANFAVALAQGPVSHVGAIWADGKPMEMDGVTVRFHHGTPDQEPDPLIVALQGPSPAYRNTAYAVFERLPLDLYGDRLPQLTFEIIRSVEPLEAMVRAMTVIPGAGEFVYATSPVTRTVRPGVSETVNRHIAHAPSNWSASIDELQAVCPNLERVALVVSWFGDDLRCSACEIRPRVETTGSSVQGAVWAVSGESVGTAAIVSLHAGRPAYGGTPADSSVIAAIRDLNARGLQVTLHPFILMDVPAGNGLPDPYGGSEQAAHPWRGRITASIAPGLAGSPEGTAAAAGEIAAFAGTAQVAHFVPQAEGVGYAGPAEWSFRRFILHQAHLAAVAGGVDAFLLGSEMRGLTRLSAGAGVYPFVDALQSLAADVKTVLAGAKVTYAADWTEYGTHQPGGGDLRFPLDPLWADANVDAVGINAYFPLADARDGSDPGGNTNPYDRDVLRAGVSGGEDYDWYYADDAARAAGMRTPIADGAYGKPWVFRAKDLAGWWSNPHVERDAGAETGATTDWVPRSKPIWFTELGVPAIDKGANQPNLFFDAKSSEAAWPRFSNGGRDDLIQRRALETVLAWWSGAHPGIAAGDNPVSPIYGAPMVDADHLYLWTWDARPFPAFPSQTDIWADGVNWRAGHWLSGRLGSVSVGGLAHALANDFGIPASVFDIGEIAGSLDGTAVPGPETLRNVLAPLLDVAGAVAVDRGPQIALLPRWTPSVARLETAHLAIEREAAAASVRRAQDADLPAEIRIAARDAVRGHRRYVVSSKRREGHSIRVEQIDLACALDPALAAGLADQLMLARWSGREEVEFSLPPGRLELDPGDVITLVADAPAGRGRDADYRIEAVEEGAARRLSARAVRAPVALRSRSLGGEARPRSVVAATGAADVLILDLPLLPGETQAASPRVAAFAAPWPGAVDVYRVRGEGTPVYHAQITAPALLVETLTSLPAGPVARWDRSSEVEVEVSSGTLSEVSRDRVLGGANPLAIVGADGDVEILQFQRAELIGPRRYRLGMLLRGLLGTERAAARPAPAGARGVLLDDAAAHLPPSLDEIGVPFTYAVLPAGMTLDSAARKDVAHVWGARALMPLSPVHLAAERIAGSGVVFSWIRRTRTGGDAWNTVDIPLGEAREAYQAELLDAGGSVLWSREAATPSVLLSDAEEVSLFGAPQTLFTLSVRQVSDTVGPGLEAREDLTVRA